MDGWDGACVTNDPKDADAYVDALLSRCRAFIHRDRTGPRSRDIKRTGGETRIDR